MVTYQIKCFLPKVCSQEDFIHFSFLVPNYHLVPNWGVYLFILMSTLRNILSTPHFPVPNYHLVPNQVFFAQSLLSGRLYPPFISSTKLPSGTKSSVFSQCLPSGTMSTFLIFQYQSAIWYQIKCFFAQCLLSGTLSLWFISSTKLPSGTKSIVLFS